MYVCVTTTILNNHIYVVPPSYEYKFPSVGNGGGPEGGHNVPPQNRPSLSHLQSLNLLFSFSGSTENSSFNISPKERENKEVHRM